MKNFETFYQTLQSDKYGLIPDVTSSQFALEILCDYLLGEDFICGDSMGVEQGNTVIVYNILKKYSRKFNKDLKKRLKKEERSLKRENKRDAIC